MDKTINEAKESPIQDPRRLEQENRALWNLAMATDSLIEARGNCQQVCARALQLAQDLAGAQRGLLLLANNDSGLYTIESHQGFTPEELDGYLEAPLFDKEYSGLIDDLRMGKGVNALKAHPLLGGWFPADAQPPSHALAMVSDGGLRGLMLLGGGEGVGGINANILGTVLHRFAGRALETITNAILLQELKDKTDALEAASGSLVEAEKLALAGQMSGTVAHQLRNPLSVISASVQLLMQDLAEDAEAFKAMELVCQKVSDMDATIAVLQELAKPLNLQMKLADVSDSLHTIQRFIAPRCQAQGVELAVGMAGDLPKVWLDETRFQRSLLDLCVNSLQEMTKGGRLVLAAAQFGQRIEVRVEDSGPGIPPELAAKLFEPFFSTKARGSGLGLYNVKRVADAMGVRLEVHNLEPHGASFRFNFPVTHTKPQPILGLAMTGRPAREPKP